MRRGFEWHRIVPGILLLAMAPAWGRPALAAAEAPRPIRALLITGGCCHDYERQKKILSEGTSARAPIDWTIIHQGGTTTDTKIPFYGSPDWAKGYDVVVHNECFAGVADPSWTERILRPHRDGLPAVVIHCAMHCYRDKTDEWFRFLGVTSHGHGANYPFEVVNIARDNPIMKGFGDSWQAPKGELYLISKVWDTATPLAHALSRDSKKYEVCIWANQYGKARVFGTTLGHHNEEMSDRTFLDVVTRGLLWAVGKLDDAHFSAAKTVRVPEDLARGKPATASASQQGHNPSHGNDGDPETRWCAPDDRPGAWWQVDLGKPEELTGCRILWEQDGSRYRYKVEGSPDGKAWSILADRAASEDRDQEQTLEFRVKGIRYVRITATQLDPGHWESFYDFQVFGTKTVESAATGGGRPRTISGTGLLAGIKAPRGFEVSLFAAPPDVHYPTCLAAAPNGEVFVGIDENGSIDAKAGRGRVVRCVDADGDGKADRFNVFAEMDSPRGLVFDDGTLYVLHPPALTAYHDVDGDGKADRSEDLVRGIGFDLKHRGADHTTNGIRLGIDGWIYIAVGDYGFVKAEGKDGTTLQLQGGGVARVRTDGSGLEVYARGQRNIYDVAIDPELDLFTRDNTNDGGGWDVRLSQVIPTGNYGYPRLFTNFPDEIVPPLADYGGGSPTGSLYLQEPGLPPELGDSLYTCEWGRSFVYRHPLEPRGAGFKAGQEPFVELPRPTDMDVDGRSRIYISSWREGGFTYSGPHVGYVIRVAYPGIETPPFPDLKAAREEQLVRHLDAPSQVLRLNAQRALLRRGVGPSAARDLEALARSGRSRASRAAAVFTLAQGLGTRAHPALLRLARIDAVREFALRALADRKGDAAGIPAQPFVEALTDRDPRVRLQAVAGLARLDRREAAGAILPLTDDPDPLVAHVAVNALVALRAIDPALRGLDASTPRLIPGASRVLQALHDPRVVAGLIEKQAGTHDPEVRRGALKALCRLDHREAEWDGGWWGTRPDTSGPYYKHVAWDQTETIERVLRAALKEADTDTLRWLLPELVRNKIDFEEVMPKALALAEQDPAFRAKAVDLLQGRPKLSPAAVRLIAGVAASDGEGLEARARALRALRRHEAQADARDALVVALAPIARSDAPPADLLAIWRDYAREGGHARHVADFRKRAEGADPSVRALALAVLIQVESHGQSPPEARAEARRALERAWEAPATAASLLEAIGRTSALKYAHQVRSYQKDANPEVRQAATLAARRLSLDRAPSGPAIARLPVDRVMAEAAREHGDAALGAQLFQSQGCVSCHTTSKAEPVKGPYLGDIANRYSRAELADSILRPSAKIAQGFETQRFATADGKVLDGFVVRESGDEVEIRNSAGLVTLLAKKDIDERARADASIMPNGLVDTLTVRDLASLLAYLESLKGK